MNNNRKHNHSRIRRMVAAVLVVAIAVVFVGVVLVFQCLSFDEDGAHVVDRYGVLAMEEGDRLEDTGSTEEPQESKEPDAQPAEETVTTRAAMLSAASIADADTTQQLIQLANDGTLDTVIVNIKDSSGYLNISVDTNAVENVEYITENDADALETAIGTLHDAGVYVIGRIYCMHDQQATAQNADLAMQFEGGGTWLDYDNTRWLDITNRDAVDYISDIAESAVETGCDEILLDEFTFPMRGHLDRIDFADYPSEQAEILQDALRDIQKAVGDEVPVSLTADSISALTDLSDSATEDGIPAGDVAELLTAASRILVPADSADEAAQAVDEIRQIAAEAVVLPVLDSIQEWMEYDGDAVLRAVDNTAQAIAVMNGEESAEDDSSDYEDENDYDAYNYNDDSYEDESDEDDSSNGNGYYNEYDESYNYQNEW
ncbi:MAG: putative glycoside hydrolase [Clostridia bacterium]|nr:putative glycoside hydrolase [Clostridia bacterium]